MKVIFHKNFIKNFEKRIKPYPSLLKKFKERYQLFIKNKDNPVLKNHPLSGMMKNKYSFGIMGDMRVIYQQEDNETVIFLDIGTHNQVYK